MDTIYRNTDQSASGTIRNSDGTVYNLTDKTVEFFIRTTAGRVLLYRVATVAQPTSGNYAITFLPSDSVNEPDGTYIYGFLVRDDLSGDVVYAGGGTITLVTP